jgi:hypothetical protein
VADDSKTLPPDTGQWSCYSTSPQSSLIHEVFSRPAVRDELQAELKKIVTAVEELLRRIPDLSIPAVPEYHFGGGDYAFFASLPGRFTPGQPLSGWAAQF